MAVVIPYSELKAKIESRKPKPVPTYFELKARVHTPRPARAATENKPARPEIAGDPWTYFGQQASIEVARQTAYAFHPNCEYVITNFGVVVEHRKKTRAQSVGGGRSLDKPWGKTKVVLSGHVSGMKGERFEIGTGFQTVCETKPVTVIEEYTKQGGGIGKREIPTPDDHVIVRVKGKAKRIRRPRPGHKWKERASKVNGGKS